MIRKLIPVLLVVIGVGVGIGAGLFLRPAPDPEAKKVVEEIPPELQPDYVKMNNQFVIPIVENGRVGSVVILALSLEVNAGSSDAVFAKEPKLRDAFLQTLFDHANAGGFRGSFTDGANIVLLRRALLEVAQSTMPDTILDVLIADIARQDT